MPLSDLKTGAPDNTLWLACGTLRERLTKNMQLTSFPCGLTARVFLLVAGLAVFSARAQDGIYADFVTSLGSFTCRLDSSVAPKTVANFIGLATGERPWIDTAKGTVNTNGFFQGITFHRVIDGFMVQTGSRNGAGTDGPGYVFGNEVKDSVKFDQPFLLAMANSGPDSNGSQFFLTVASAPHLNNVHTIFGRVTSGTNVVMAISKVAVDTNANHKPLTNVVLESVAIRRVGGTAQNFNIHNKGLPVVTNYPLGLAAGPDWVSLSFTNRQYAHNRLFVSTNLTDWSADNLGVELTTSFTNRVYRTNEPGAHFYRFAQAIYPGTTLAPKSLAGKILVLDLAYQTGPVQVRISHDAAGKATSYTRSDGKSGTNDFSYYIQHPYRAQIGYVFSAQGVWPLEGRINFLSAGDGLFAGVEYWFNFLEQPVQGTFRITQ